MMRLRRTVGVLSAVLAVMTTAACGITGPSGALSPTPTTTPTSAAGEQGTATTQADRFTPLVANVASTPRWFTGSDEKMHLAYELQLLNGTAVTASLLEVEVRNQEDEVIATLDGDALEASTGLLTSFYSDPTTSIPPSTMGVVWMDVVLDSIADVPTEVRHSITVGMPEGLPIAAESTYQLPSAEVDDRAPVILSPPVEGAGWIAVGSCCDGPHRRGIQPVNGQLKLSQRFAIDFNRMNEDGVAFVGDPGINDSWVFFGDPVYAVADATVVDARNDLPEQIPNAPVGVTLETADGNFVVLDLGDGRYAFYAHMQPGSVTVEPGDIVRAGDQIGKLGNTGSSTGPHLHFHVSDGISALSADGVPYEFSAFDVEGQTAGYELLGDEINTGKVITVSTDTAGPRENAYPLGRDVITFPSP